MRTQLDLKSDGYYQDVHLAIAHWNGNNPTKTVAINTDNLGNNKLGLESRVNSIVVKSKHFWDNKIRISCIASKGYKIVKLNFLQRFIRAIFGDKETVFKDKAVLTQLINSAKEIEEDKKSEEKKLSRSLEIIDRKGIKADNVFFLVPPVEGAFGNRSEEKTILLAENGKALTQSTSICKKLADAISTSRKNRLDNPPEEIEAFDCFAKFAKQQLTNPDYQDSELSGVKNELSKAVETLDKELEEAKQKAMEKRKAKLEDIDAELSTLEFKEPEAENKTKEELGTELIQFKFEILEFREDTLRPAEDYPNSSTDLKEIKDRYEILLKKIEDKIIENQKP